MQCAEWGKMSKSPLHGGAFAVNDRPPRFAGPNAFLLEDVVGGQFAVLSSVLLSSEKPRMLSNASLLTPPSQLCHPQMLASIPSFLVLLHADFFLLVRRRSRVIKAHGSKMHT
jgi:hypothetical protein